MGLQDSNTTDDFDNTQVVIRGGTDNTSIGNVGDALKTTGTLVISQAAQELPTFTVYVPAAGVANGKSMVSLVNASGSTVKLKIREIKLINVQTTSVTGVVLNFEFRRITNHSSGTSLTPNPHDTTDSLSGSATARTGATITGEGVILYRYKWSSDEHGVGAQDVESMDAVMQALNNCYTTARYTKPITLNANEGFHIKQTINSSVGTYDIFVTFTQE